jgi:hypothetical protein
MARAPKAPDDEKVRTTVYIPRSLSKRVGHYCVEEELAMTDVVVLALTEFLDRRAKR